MIIFLITNGERKHFGLDHPSACQIATHCILRRAADQSKKSKPEFGVQRPNETHTNLRPPRQCR